MAVGRPLRSAEILAVGSELLTPLRLDTNSLFLTGLLDGIGITVRGKVVVGDDRGELAMRLRHALERADVVVTTGGLGPTDDDLTREVVANVLARPLDEHADLLEALRQRFAARGREMPDINRRQAQVPRGAAVLANPNGTAPGLLLDTPDGRVVICLPGPTREARPMVEAHVLPVLAARADQPARRQRIVMVTGRAESEVEQLVRPLDAGFQAGAVRIERGTFATPGQIEIHLSAHGDADVVDPLLEAAVASVCDTLGDSVFSTVGESLEVVVGRLLEGRGWTVAAAESCTGGLVTGRLTEVAGSSGWVRGGVVAYDNAVKQTMLDVPEPLIAAHGAVSEPVALAMAQGVRRRLGADIGIAITGIAGPGGGTEAKPVGTVVFAVDAGRPRARTIRFPGDRSMVRAFSVAAALDMVRREALSTA